MKRTGISLGLVLLLAPAGTVTAAESGPEGWLIPFAFGWRPPVAGFNAVFRNNAVPETRQNHFGWGVELRSLVGGGMLAGPMYFNTTDEAGNDSFQLRVNSTGIFGEIAYRLEIARVILVVPMVGVGGLGQKYHLRRRVGERTLEELLQSRESQVDINSAMKLAGMAALELGLTANTRAGRFGVALRGGYLYSPFDPDWRSGTGERIRNTPAGTLRGPFVSVGLLLLPAAEVSATPALPQH